jgi:hypothetical protein
MKETEKLAMELLKIRKRTIKRIITVIAIGIPAAIWVILMMILDIKIHQWIAGILSKF